MQFFLKKNINTFVDAFGGSGVVTTNYLTPKNYLFNDKDSWIIELFKWLKKNNIAIILKKIESIINQYNLRQNQMHIWIIKMHTIS